MNTSAAPPVLAGQTSRPFGAGRVLSLVFGSIALLLAVAFLAAGGVGVWGLSNRDSSGYFSTAGHQLTTSSYALVTDDLDVGTDAPSWIFSDRFGSMRVQASSAEPIFIGVGPTAAVEAFLGSVRHDQITDFDVDPFSVSTTHVQGSAQPQAPTSQGFWRVQASGPGTQTISWPLEKGTWSVVAMNADGSSNVAVDVKIGARVPALRWLTVVAFGIGALVLLVGAGLIYLGARSPRQATRGA